MYVRMFDYLFLTWMYIIFFIVFKITNCCLILIHYELFFNLKVLVQYYYHIIWLILFDLLFIIKLIFYYSIILLS